MTDATALPPGFPVMPVGQAHALITAPGSMLELEDKEIRGVTYKTWKNAPPTLRQIFEVGRMWGPREHLVHESERVTFAAHHAAATTLAHQLIADGVKPGDRVAIIMRNLPEWPVAFWATVLIGAIATPLNAWWTGAELEYGLQDSGSVIAICDAERWERIREHVDACPALRKAYVSRSTDDIADPRVAKLEGVIATSASWGSFNPAPLPDIPLQPDDDVTIFYTSGTTGKPKGAVITHRNIVSNIFNAIAGQARAFLRRGEQPPAPDPTAPPKAFLLSIPFFHATGCFAILAPSMLQGWKVVMQRRWVTDEALPLMEREKITHFGGVPTIAWQVIEHPRLKAYDLSSVESVSYGGAPAAPELVKRIKEVFPKVTPGQGWGMTETAATAVSNFAEDYLLRPASCGYPAPSGEAKIMSPDGAELPRGEVGELWYKGPIVVRGYWNKPEATAQTFVDGWVKTGDLAKMDEEGFLYIVDRAKDMLIRGGENIYCVEVENALYDHPAVMDAAVVGITHKVLGEEPGAVVTLKPGASATEEELRHHVAQTLAAFKVPTTIKFMSEPLPRNANGKILKPELKRLFQENSAA